MLGAYWASGWKGRIQVESFLSMEEECKGEEEGATTEEETSKERGECYDKRRKVKKKKRRRLGTRKLHQLVSYSRRTKKYMR